MKPKNYPTYSGDEIVISPLDNTERSAVLSHYISLLDHSEAKEFYDKAINFVDLEKYVDHSHIAEGLTLFPPKTDIFGITERDKFPPDTHSRFTFVDLFAGIGGFRIAAQNCGGRCVYSSEMDMNAKCTYYHNFGEVPFGDITQQSVKDMIPSHFDMLCGGFPCQAFSIAGYQKGFDDARGTLFFEIAEITKKHRPKVLLLENVKNLMNHDKGRTYRVIKETLVDLGYKVFSKVLNAMEYANVPQNRERIFIVAVDQEQKDIDEFTFPEPVELTVKIKDFINYQESDQRFFYTPDRMSHYDILERDITRTDTLYQWRRQYVRENKNKVCPTLTANMGTGGHNVPLVLTPSGIRKLTPYECLNFQGFPDKYTFPDSISISSKYKQAGNSVVVPLVQRICQEIVNQVLL